MNLRIDPTGVIKKNNLTKIENRSWNLVLMFSRWRCVYVPSH